jgi:hypothetical protein
MTKYTDRIINWDNDQWRVVGQGAVNTSPDAYNDDLVYVHLASTTRFREQRNGRNPIQIGDWVPVGVLRAGQEV